MGNPFTEVSISGYNSNPPSDDGSQTPENKITWSKVKEKLGDPLKTVVENLNTSANTAFGIVAGGVNVQTDSYTILSTDQNKIVVLTGGSTVTLLPADEAGTPFLVTIVNLTGSSITLEPDGSETIDAETSITIPDKMGLTVDTDGSNWFSRGQNYKQVYDGPTSLIRPPEGYLTLTSGTPVITSDVTSATAVYYTPDIGEYIPISDGTDVEMEEFSELTLALSSNHVLSSIYDVFLFKQSGVVLIGTGPAWNTATAGSGARGTGAGTTELERWSGLLVNKNSMTARNGSDTYTVGAREGVYVGSIFINVAAGQISCHRSYGQSRKWGIWNYYNRKTIVLKVGDTGSAWNYSSQNIRQSHNQANEGAVFFGLAEELTKVDFRQTLTGGSDEIFTIGVGWNVTNAFTGVTGRTRFNGSTTTARAYHVNSPFLGIANVACCEQANSGLLDAAAAGEANMLMTIEWRG